VAAHPEIFLETDEVVVVGMQDRLDRMAVCALLRRRQSDIRMFIPPTPGQWRPSRSGACNLLLTGFSERHPLEFTIPI
jgi:hypothetical protein